MTSSELEALRQAADLLSDLAPALRSTADMIDELSVTFAALLPAASELVHDLSQPRV